MAPKIYDLLYHKFVAGVNPLGPPFVGWCLPLVGYNFYNQIAPKIIP
jgi:hypothetical protein